MIIQHFFTWIMHLQFQAWLNGFLKCFVDLYNLFYDIPQNVCIDSALSHLGYL